MFEGMKNSDWIIVIATLLGPVLAVQAQKWIESWRANRDRQLWLFRSLMATRAAMLNSLHVEALNAIPIDFYGNRPIIDIWEEYFAHLGNEAMPKDVWISKRQDIFIRLLSAVGKKVGYKFNVVELHRIYFPKGHSQLENDQAAIISGLAKLLGGDEFLENVGGQFPAAKRPSCRTAGKIAGAID